MIILHKTTTASLKKQAISIFLLFSSTAIAPFTCAEGSTPDHSVPLTFVESGRAVVGAGRCPPAGVQHAGGPGGKSAHPGSPAWDREPIVGGDWRCARVALLSMGGSLSG